MCLDLESSFYPRTFNELLKEAIILIEDRKRRLSKLLEFMDYIEEEKRKVEPFKQELPFTMILLNDGVFSFF